MPICGDGGCLIWLATSFGPASPVKEIANASLDPRTFVQFFPAFRLLEFMTGMATGMIFLRRSLPSTTADSNVSKGFRTARATVLEVLVLALSMGCFYLFTFIGVFAYLPRFGEPGIVANRWLTYSGGMFFHAAVIYVFARSGGWVSRFFGSRTMVFLGEISFAFYMIHYPLNLFVKQKYWFGSNFSLWYFALLTLALTIGVSAWLYFLVEVPAKAALVKWYEGKLRPRQLPAEMLVKPMQQLASTPMLRLMILLIVVPVVVTAIIRIGARIATRLLIRRISAPDARIIATTAPKDGPSDQDEQPDRQQITQHGLRLRRLDKRPNL